MKYIAYLIVILFFSPTVLYSQESKEKEISDLIKSSRNAYINAELESSNAYAEKALAQSIKNKYQYGIAYSHFYIGQATCDLGKFNIALKHLVLAENLDYSKTDPLLMAEISLIRSRLFSLLSADHSLNEQNKGLIFINKIANREDADLIRIKVFTNISGIYFNKENLDSSRSYLTKARRILISLDEKKVPPQQLTDFYSLWAHSFTLKKEYDSAAYYLKKSLKITEKYKYKNTARTYMSWGMLESQRKKGDSAIFYFTKALSNMEGLHYLSIAPWASYSISETYKKFGNLEKSNEYKIKTIELQEKLNRDNIDFPKTTFNMLLQEQENNAQKKTKEKTTILIVIILLLVFLFLYYFFIKHRTAKKTINTQEEIIASKEQKAYFLEQKVNEAFEIVTQLAKENNPEFLTRFREVYPHFIEALLKANSKLLPSELTFCAYLYLNFSSKDIAQYTFVTPRAVQLRKNRLRKRLNISSDEDIYLWMKNLS